VSRAEEAGVDEAALIARVGRGDQQAFRALVDAHGRAMHRLAWRMLLDASEAEDVVQEAFARLWTGAPAWRAGEARVGGWLRRVCTNLCLDRLRRRRFWADSEVPETPDARPLADAAIDGVRLETAIADALRALPDRQRAALVLTYYEQMPNARAAELMELNIKAFESLLLRSRAALRRQMAQRGFGGGEGDAA